MTDRSFSAAGDVSRSVVITGDGNTATLVFGDSGVSLPLRRWQRSLPKRRSRELDLLDPRRGGGALIGRDVYLDDMQDWLNAEDDISVRAITGRAGSGKTRLAIELCRRVDPDAAPGAWAAGFLPASELPGVVETLATRDFDWQRPTLLVIDYAGQVSGALARWFDRLATYEIATKLRFLLLEREAPEGFGWWHELTRPGSNTGRDRLALFDDAALRPGILPGLDDPDERRAVMGSALAAGALPEPGADPAFDARLTEPRFANPLALTMAGVLARDRGPTAALALRHLEMARALARRELDRLQAVAGPADSAAMTHLAAFNGLAGGLPVAGLSARLAAELDVAGQRGDAGRIATLLQQELPPASETEGAPEAAGRIGTVQPDLVGEGLIVEALRGTPEVEAGAAALMRRAFDATGQRAAQALMRLLQDYAYALEDASATEGETQTAHRLMGWLRHLADDIADLDALEPLADALPEQTTVLREDALAITARGATLAKAQYKASGAEPDAARAAGWQNNLANRLSALGRREDALSATQKAVDLRRTLAEARPDAFTPDLAGALNNLAAHLSALGRREAALSAAQEAADLYRPLAEARPDAFTPDFAGALNTLSNRLSDLGCREPALSAAQEAVDLRRPLAEARPDAFTPDLATALNTLSNRLSDLGCREAALSAAQEAVDLYRPLAEARPDAFTPALATALNNLANSLSALGHREAALSAAQEAVNLYRPLAEARPDAFAENLSVSLGALATLHRVDDAPEAALTASREAIAVLKPVFLESPQAVARWMMMHLRLYDELIKKLGHEQEPELIGEIVMVFQQIEQQRPDE